jgi:serine/threonine protein kinase
MWSLGIILYFLCYSRVPWSQLENTEFLTREILDFKEPVYPDGGERVSPIFISFMSRLLVKESRKRPTAATLLTEIESIRTPSSLSTSRMISLSAL